MSAAAENAQIAENGYVQELLAILRENKIDAHELVSIIGNVAAMERDMGKAAEDLSAMRKELAEMREETGHPIRAALQNAARGLAGKINAVRSGIRALKNKIISGCKRAIEAFKTGGVSALNNLAGFFDIRRELENTRDTINGAIKYNEGQIAKIESMSEEYHAAGRALKNIGRIMSGREPLQDIQPNGTLARLIEFPFSSEVRRLNRSLNRTNKTLAGLDRLEKAAARHKEQDRPSTLGEMKRLKAEVVRRKKEAPVKNAEKKADAAI
jgi:prefoldin subunit 5